VANPRKMVAENLARAASANVVAAMSTKREFFRPCTDPYSKPLLYADAQHAPLCLWGVVVGCAAAVIVIVDQWDDTRYE
jgi:hypothetical protein